MIWIPQKEKCDVWNEFEDVIYIRYRFNDDVMAQIQWKKLQNKFVPHSLTFKKLDILQKHDGLEYWVSLPILPCLQASCQNFPELRYNGILKKWFCFCASSMICTHNTDESELQHPTIVRYLKENSVNEDNGFFDNPIDALLNWNKDIATEIIEISNDIVKK